MSTDRTALTRRTFVASAGALGALAACGTAANTLYASAPQAFGDESGDGESIVWTHCHVNCGGACVLQCHVQDGELKYVESDNTGDASFGAVEARACLRGRSIRPWLGSADRLNYPMKRVEGTKRGDGQYERISWDEALDTIASEFKRITEKYGNESVFIQECSGVEQNIMMNNPFFRLFNLLGGEVTRYGSYSSAAISFGAVPYTYGKSWGNRSLKTIQEGELVVMFGFAPDERAGDVSDHTLAHNLLISGFEEMERDNTRLISRQISEGRLDIGEIARAFVGAMGRKTGAALDAALEGKHAGCYSRDVDALVFTDDDIDDYANMIEHGRPDLDFIQCREIASQAVTDWNDGHAMDGFTEFLYDYANEHAPAESVKQGGGIRY